jgi:serine/threonine protein kinase/Flp pilus assembly protein TadD
MIGTTISHYKILEKLGEGGMGIVYKAEDVKLKRIVALKMVPRQAVATNVDKARFEREAQSAGNLNHPNISTVYEFDEEAGQAFIVMEYIEGKTLRQKIAERPLPIGEAIDVAIAIAGGLTKAHAEGIVHRDIKADNVMISSDGVAKIMDFGLAAMQGHTRVTKEGTTVGTIAYMSPEQALGEKLDQRTDIWSFGVVIYEMVTGRLPFSGDYEQAIVYRILNEEPEPITSLRSNVPIELERIVKKAMQKKCDIRYQHVQEMLVDLRTLKEETESGFSEIKPPRLQLVKRGHTILYAGLAAIAILSIAVGVFLFQRSGEKKKGAAAHREGNGTPATAESNSIAVLPFADLSPEKGQEYFCDGMTEAIITDLAKIGHLVVMSPAAVSRYKGKSVDLAEIANRLRVRYVVEGTIQRMGTTLRVSAQLTDVESGVQLWADRFDGSIRDVFKVQDDISYKIVGALQVTIGSAAETQPLGHPTQNLDAYDLYLRAHYYLKKQSVKDITRAVELLEQAVRIDPNFAAALAALGEAYSQKSFFDQPLKKEWEEKASVAIEKALAIDANLAEAYVAEGKFLWTPANHFPHERAIAAYRRAIELNPNLDEAHESLGLVYFHLGLFEAALDECREALQLNPFSAMAQRTVGAILLYSGQYEGALAELRKVPQGVTPQIVPTEIAITLFYLGRMREANEVLEEAYRQIPEDPFLLSAQALLFAKEGRTNEAMQKIQLAEKREKTYLGHFHHAAYNIGSAYALMKDNEKAVAWLQKAADDGFPCYPTYHTDPNLDKIRQDPQFMSLIKDLKKRWESYKALT